MQPNQVEIKEFAANARALLHDDPRLYRNFGVYWFFVKAILRRIYDRAEMPNIGAFEDQAVVERMPHLGARELLDAAIEEYAQNATFNMGRTLLHDPDGERFMLYDPDMEG